MKASVCQGSPAPTPSSYQLEEAAVKMGVGCHCCSTILKIQSPMLPREIMPEEGHVCSP